MSAHARSDATGGNREAAGELVLVTGPSHAGKSTLIDELLGRVDPPVYVVSIDEVIGASELPTEELQWERGLDAAYDAAAERTSELLAGGGLVFYESTFTYVPPDSRPAQLHPDQLHRLLEIADERDANALVVQLTASLEVVQSRRERTNRLTDRIVAEAWRMHAGAALQATRLLRLDTSELSAEQAASLVLGHMGGRRPA